MARLNKGNRAKRMAERSREAARLRELALKQERGRQANIAEMKVIAERLKRETLGEKKRLVEEATGQSWYYHMEEDGTLMSKKIKELWPEEALAQREGRPSPRFSVRGLV